MTGVASGRVGRLRDVACDHAVLGIVGLGAAIRFALLGTQDFWFDEYLAVEVIRREPGEILPRILDAETNPPVYFLLAAAWERVFGDSEIGLRSFSVLLGTATIPVVYAAGTTLASRRAGLIAAALTAASPFTVWYSLEARPYPLLVFLSALSFLFFARALQGRGEPSLWGWAGASILALGTHYLAVVLIAIEAAWLLWVRRESRIEVALAIGAIGAAALALLPLAAAQRELASWIGAIDLGERVLQVPAHLLVGMSSPWGLLVPLAVAALVVSLAVIAVRASRAGEPLSGVAAGVLLAGLAIVGTAALVGADYVNSRNLADLWPAFAVAIGVVLGASVAGRLGTVVAGALCALGIALSLWTAVETEAGRPDWDGVVDGLASANDGRVIISRSPLTAPLSLHLDGGRVAAAGEVLTTTELDVIELRPVEDYSVGPCWWVGFCGGENLLGGSELPFEVPAGFELVGHGSTELFGYRRYRSPAPVTLPAASAYSNVLVQEAH